MQRACSFYFNRINLRSHELEHTERHVLMEVWEIGKKKKRVIIEMAKVWWIFVGRKWGTKFM